MSWTSQTSYLALFCKIWDKTVAAQTFTRGFGATTIQSSASERQKPYSYTKIPKSSYYTLLGRAKWIRPLLHVLTNRLFMSTGNESESKIICMQMKFHMQVPSSSGGRRGTGGAVCILQGLSSTSALFGNSMSHSIHQVWALSAIFPRDRERERGRERERERRRERRGGLTLHDSRIRGVLL